MVRKQYKRRKYSAAQEEDPMAGTSNLVDVMLVLAVGFLIFIVMAANTQDIFSNQSEQVEQGEALNSTPNIGEGVGEGYSEVGTVYKDPTTGELILIEEK